MALYEWIEFLIPYAAVLVPALFCYWALLSTEHVRQQSVHDAVRKFKEDKQAAIQQTPPATPPTK